MPADSDAEQPDALTPTDKERAMPALESIGAGHVRTVATVRQRADACCLEDHFSEEADDYLAQAVGYLVERNPAAAIRLIDDVLDFAHRLAAPDFERTSMSE